MGSSQRAVLTPSPELKACPPLPLALLTQPEGLSPLSTAHSRCTQHRIVHCLTWERHPTQVRSRCDPWGPVCRKVGSH